METNSLPDRAILVRLTRSMYQPYAFDEKATELAGGKEQGRFNKRLLKTSSRLQRCNAAYNDLYAYVKGHTVPWLDDGVRMLKAADYFEFAQGARALIARATAASEVLADNWTDEVAADEVRFRRYATVTGLATMFNVADYPTASQIRGMFNAEVKFFPVPQSSDFRVEISDADREVMDNAVRQVEADVTKYVLAEILDPVKKLVEKLKIPIGATDGAGKRIGIFRDSILENLTDIIERAPKLNINDDPQITDTISAIKDAFGHYNMPEALRESPDVRSKVQARLDALANKLSAYGMAGQQP